MFKKLFLIIFIFSIPLLPNAARAGGEVGKVAVRFYQVVKVVDGDTIDVSINGKTARVRLIGIDAPETVDPKKPAQCFGLQASAKAKQMLANKQVRLVSDSTQDDKDIYGRLLRYVYLPDGTFFNQWMIANGYAHEYTYIIPYKFQAVFKATQKQARDQGRGLWAANACPAPAVSSPATATSTAATKQIAGHVYYTSGYFTSATYYCDTDPLWKNLSKNYLQVYPSESALKKVYPKKHLHAPC